MEAHAVGVAGRAQHAAGLELGEAGLGDERDGGGLGLGHAGLEAGAAGHEADDGVRPHAEDGPIAQA